MESSGWQQEMEEKRDEMADQTLLPQIEKQTAIAIFWGPREAYMAGDTQDCILKNSFWAERNGWDWPFQGHFSASQL